MLYGLLPQSISSASLYTLLPNSKDFAGLYLFSNKTLIFEPSGVIPVPLSAETYPSHHPQKHNSIFPKYSRKPA